MTKQAVKEEHNCCWHEVERKHFGSDGIFLPPDIREKLYSGRSDLRLCCICDQWWWLVWTRMR